MSQPYRIVLMVVWALAVPAATALAQPGKGSIQGRVADSSNGVLQGASVTVAPGPARAVTNTEGEYVIVGLAPGPYAVTVNFIGFQEFTQTVNVVDGRVTRL